MIDFVYIINNNFYTKHIKNKNGKYLPFFDTNIKEELIKKNILIYTKSVGFNGIINMLKIIDIISKKSIDELNQMYVDMKEILEHNYNTIKSIDSNKMLELLK